MGDLGLLALRAGSALAAFALETRLSRRFGLGWAYRPASKGRVIAGFPEKAFAKFSSRRAQISKEQGALDFARLLRDWEQTTRDAELGTLRDLAGTIWRPAHRADTSTEKRAARSFGVPSAGVPPAGSNRRSRLRRGNGRAVA